MGNEYCIVKEKSRRKTKYTVDIKSLRIDKPDILELCKKSKNICRRDMIVLELRDRVSNRLRGYIVEIGGIAINSMVERYYLKVSSSGVIIYNNIGLGIECLDSEETFWNTVKDKQSRYNTRYYFAKLFSFESDTMVHKILYKYNKETYEYRMLFM